METKKIDISVDIPMTYEHTSLGENKPVLMFFHGFADSAEALLRRAYPQLSEKYEILAINGPFPVPQKKANEWRPAFAWYFFDFKKNKAFISPREAAEGVQLLVKKLQLEHRSKFLIGFSQGGFFIPHLLPHLQEVKHIVTIGAAYRPEDYPETLTCSVDAIHGSEDEVISLSKARETFEILKSKNPKGEFVEFKALGHTMNDESRSWLAAKIDQVFKL